jgi:hypothetical protein
LSIIKRLKAATPNIHACKSQFSIGTNAFYARLTLELKADVYGVTALLASRKEDVQRFDQKIDKRLIHNLENCNPCGGQITRSAESQIVKSDFEHVESPVIL